MVTGYNLDVEFRFRQCDYLHSYSRSLLRVQVFDYPDILVIYFGVFTDVKHFLVFYFVKGFLKAYKACIYSLIDISALLNETLSCKKGISGSKLPCESKLCLTYLFF